MSWFSQVELSTGGEIVLPKVPSKDIYKSDALVYKQTSIQRGIPLFVEHYKSII